MDKAQGIVVDVWFAGFFEREEEPVYFCVYLGRADDRDVSSTAAKGIAIRLVSDYCDQYSEKQGIRETLINSSTLV